jgi:hypothetical protein
METPTLLRSTYSKQQSYAAPFQHPIDLLSQIITMQLQQRVQCAGKFTRYQTSTRALVVGLH